MPGGWFEMTIPVFERLKNVRSLDREDIQTGISYIFILL
jgi:hypothetical protein